MGARKVTKQEFYYIKEKLDKDTRPGSNVQRVAKAVQRSAETVRMIDLYNSFGAYTRRREIKYSFPVSMSYPTEMTPQALLEKANADFRKTELKRRVDSHGRWIALLFFATMVLTMFVLLGI